MTEYGENKEGVFHPSQPSMEDLLSRAGMNGWAGLNASPAGGELTEKYESADNEIKRAAYRLSKTPDGQRVIDFLIGETLRRSPYKFATGQSMDQTVPYVIERAGQNATTIFLLNMIVGGRELDDRDKKSKKSKKKSKK